MDGSYLRKEEKKDAIISLMLLTKKNSRQNQGQSMRRWPWLAWKIRKKRCIISNSCNWKNFFYVSHWGTWEMWCGDHWYTRCIHTCGFGQTYHHCIERKAQSINISHGSKIIQEEHFILQERQTRYICENVEGPIRTAMKCTPILPQIGQGFT